MDLSFNQNGFPEHEPAPLDHALLRAALAAQREAQAAAAGPAPAPARAGGDEDSLTEILVGGPGWREASTERGGCFSRAEAGRQVNAP